MRNEKYIVDNKIDKTSTNYIRITKNQARKMYMNGYDIHVAMINANMLYLNAWNLFGICINHKFDCELFDIVIDNYIESQYREYKNMGYYCKYFVDERDLLTWNLNFSEV